MRYPLIVILLLVEVWACIVAPRVVTRGSFVYFDSGDPLAEGQTVSNDAIDAIEVFYKKEPTRPFVEAGIVEAVAEGLGKDATLEDVFTELKKQAAMMQIDAVYKVELQRYDHAGDAMHATAVAIRYK
jgi:hypothetical protein